MLRSEFLGSFSVMSHYNTTWKHILNNFICVYIKILVDSVIIVIDSQYSLFIHLVLGFNLAST
jgi:hypothetical protein